jgi:hypothetical protein
MNEAEFFAMLLEEYKQKFEGGDYSGAVQAVRLCAANSIAMPEWVAFEASEAIEFYFRNAGAKQGGRGGGYLSRYRLSKLHTERHRVAEHELARRGQIGGNRPEAFERASERLRGTFAQGAAGAIKDSYYIVQKQLRVGESE